jgi:hypothetical protein
VSGSFINAAFELLLVFTFSSKSIDGEIFFLILVLRFFSSEQQTSVQILNIFAASAHSSEVLQKTELLSLYFVVQNRTNYPAKSGKEARLGFQPIAPQPSELRRNLPGHSTVFGSEFAGATPFAGRARLV